MTVIKQIKGCPPRRKTFAEADSRGTAWMSFRDHSLYLTTGKYSGTRALKGKDFSAWALFLEKEGFAPIPNYSLQVLEVIQTYDLDRAD